MVLEHTKSSIKDVYSKRKTRFTANSQLAKIKREFIKQSLNPKLQIFQVVYLKLINNLHNRYFLVKNQVLSMELNLKTSLKLTLY